jgi:hypothetical protein
MFAVRGAAAGHCKEHSSGQISDDDGRISLALFERAIRLFRQLMAADLD